MVTVTLLIAELGQRSKMFFIKISHIGACLMIGRRQRRGKDP